MLKKIIKTTAKALFVIIGTSAMIFSTALAFYKIDQDQFTNYMRIVPIFPDKFIDTLRFFPHYNPFGKQLEDSTQTISEINSASEKTSSEIVKTTLNFIPGEDREILVYLPKGYDPTNKNKRYPVLYLLHGSPGHASDWLIRGQAQSVLDQKIENKEIQPFIAVFPDGNGGNNRDSEYINSADGKRPVEDYITKKLVDYIDANFLTIPNSQNRAIGGLSEGGFGSINLGLKHQDVFGYILSFSGYGQISQNTLTRKLIDNSAKIIHDNSPIEYIPALTSKSITTLLITESKKESVQANTDLLNLLKSNGFSAEMQIYKGDHNWDFWTAHLSDGIGWLGKYWKTVQ